MTTNIPANQTLRPGLLVALSTSIRGNVTYVKKDLETGKIIESGEEVARWETERTIADPVEHERAVKARSKARSIISSVCIQTAFGLLCPEVDAPDLDKAISDARKVVDEFNGDAKVSRIRFFVVTGRVAADDVEAVKAINAEVRDLLDDMKGGIEKLDVEVVRAAANKAKEVGGMLTPDAQARITVAIEAARSAAKKIAAAGETAAVEIDRRTIRALTEARTAFLDLDGERELASPAATGRSVDLEPETAAAIGKVVGGAGVKKV
jgi:hypothetical protein